MGEGAGASAGEAAPGSEPVISGGGYLLGAVKHYLADKGRRYEIENFEGGKEVRAELMHGYDITVREEPAAAVLRSNAIE